MSGPDAAALRRLSLPAAPHPLPRDHAAVLADVAGVPEVVDLDDGSWGGPGGIREGQLRSVAALHLPAVLEFATALTGDAPTAADVVQAVLVRVHTGTSPTLPRPDLRLRRMVVREYRSPRRRWRRRRPAEARPVPGPRHDAARHPRQAPGRDAALGAMTTLPWRHRVVLVLRYHQGLTDDEAATVLARSPTAVRTRLERGLASLQATAPHAPARVPGNQEDR